MRAGDLEEPDALMGSGWKGIIKWGQGRGIGWSWASDTDEVTVDVAHPCPSLLDCIFFGSSQL